MIIDLVIFIVLGVMTGGLYALLGLSLTLIFGVMRVINVAHGEMLTLGAYTAVMLGAVGLGGVLVPVAAAILVVTFVGLIIARVLIRPLTVEGRVHEQRGMVMNSGVVTLPVERGSGNVRPGLPARPGAHGARRHRDWRSGD